MPRWSWRQLWIAGIVAFELLALSYFVLHTPALHDDADGDGVLRDVAVLRDARSSLNMRQCLPASHRDARFADAENQCVTVRERQQALVDLLVKAKLLLEDLGIVYWLDSGSLLGQYRKGDVMAWDLEADLGILGEGLQRLRESKVKLSSGYELNVWGSAVHKAYDRDNEVPVRLVEKRFGFFVDIVVFQPIVDPNDKSKRLGPPPSSRWFRCVKCLTVPGVHGATASSVKQFVVPENWILPTQPCYLREYEVRCPAQPDLYLQHFYGDDFVEYKAW